MYIFTYASRSSERFSIRNTFNRLHAFSYVPCIYGDSNAGADPGFRVRGDEIRQGDLRVLLLLSQMFMNV